MGAVSRCWQGNSISASVAARSSPRPQKRQRTQLAQFAGEKFCFIAPDALLASDEQADWPAVDEAQRYLRRCRINWYPVFLERRVNDYGAGLRRHGTWFFAKFCACLPQSHRFELQQPFRWAQGLPAGKNG
ncbi:hypothetical protein ACLK1S_15420 [Escherichia coli]